MSVEKKRRTKETDIQLSLDIYGEGKADIRTGIGFFDHMLTALAVHANWNLSLFCEGDLNVCGHHTVEDCGILLGDALAEAVQATGPLNRYGNALIPMDEALARAVVDLSGRAYLVFQAGFQSPMVGAFETQLTEEFFRAFAMHGKLTLHLAVLYGANDHHQIEALFKATAHSLAEALAPREGLLSTKGVLD